MANVNTVRMAPRLPGTAVGASSDVELDLLDSAGNAAGFYLPGSGRMLGKSWNLRALGRATGGTTVNLVIKLYVGSTAIATSGNLVFNSVSGNWRLEAQVVGDATSGRLQGILKGVGYETPVAQAQLTAGLSSVDFTTEGANLVKATAQFSTSNAGNSAILDELSLEVC